MVKNVNKPPRAATSYHNVKMPKRQTSFNPEWTKELEFISKRSRDSFHGFCTLCRCEICIYLFFAFIICLFMYFYYLQKSRNVMFSGTVPDYLFIYVFLLFPEVQKCYVFWHSARLFIYLCISIISRSPEMLCFLALCQIIYLFMYFYYFQKSRNVMFSGTLPDYLFIYVFLLFPEVQKCYIFRHCALQVHLRGQFLKQTSQCLE